jgi:broad specificity phosphatase PhoE
VRALVSFAIGGQTRLSEHWELRAGSFGLWKGQVMPNADGATRLLLIRHGEIQANIDKLWHGSTDSPLTPKGREQARRVAAHLARERPEVAGIYTSALQRARQTAVPIERAFGMSAVLERDLREYGIGELEGESYEDLYVEHRFFDMMSADLDFAPPGGESARAVGDRTLAALEQIAARHPKGSVAVVGHGFAIALVLARLIDSDPHAWRGFHQDNCGVSELVLEPRPQLLRFNATEHL